MHPSPLRFDLPSHIAASWPVERWWDTHVLLAVSGGADSVAMLRAMFAIKAKVGGNGRLFVGHLNHGLRHVEADADEDWLAALCSKLDATLKTAKVDVAARAAQDGDGVEAAARSARYEFLGQQAERLGARYVVTAHTADDQVETVLHRIIRGTGFAGLAGIRQYRALSPSVTVVRPMLAVWRREVTDYLLDLGQEFRTDASNDDLRYARNRLRHELLPWIRDRFNPNVDIALTQLGSQAQDVRQFIESSTVEILNQCVTFDRTSDTDGRRTRRIEIDCTKLAAQPSIIIREVIKAAWEMACWPRQSMGYAEWQLLASLVAVNYQPSTVNLPSNVVGCRGGNLLELSMPGLA